MTDKVDGKVHVYGLGVVMYEVLVVGAALARHRPD